MILEEHVGTCRAYVMDAKLEPGSTLYLYTARNGRFRVWEGVVTEDRRRHWTRLIVTIKGRAGFEFLPMENDIGRLLTCGPKLWLLERDDALAKKLFLEYELGKLEELKRAMAMKEELIKVLRE